MAAEADRWSRVKDLLADALERATSDRARFLDGACGRDAGLRAEVERLLAAHDGARGFLEEPAAIAAGAVPETRSPGFVEGARIGRYRIRRRIGAGGMGVVYEGEQEQPHRTVALKVLRPGIASGSALRRFRREAELLGRLRHPAIAAIYEAGTHGDPSAPGGEEAVPFFAMELVEGRPLVEHADAKGLGTRERVGLFVRICDAVEYAHREGVLHRDLKPGNILVDESGHPKVLDFGVARSTDSDLRATTLRTRVGEILGTLPYMSPEQLAGDPDLVDERSDVYALGVVLYELLAGRLPHDLANRSLPEAARILGEEDPTPLSSVSRLFRSDLDTIVGKALEKEKGRRYASAANLAADLRRYLEDRPISARPASAIYRLRKFADRNRILVAGVCAVFLLLVAGLSASLVFKARSDENARIAKSNEEEAKKRADDVLSLSALQDLDDLTGEADRLWPAHPENIRRFEDWIERAQRLVNALPQHEERLAALRANAIPWTEEDRAKHRASHPRLGDLGREKRRLEFHRKRREALESSGARRDPTPEEVGVDLASLPATTAGVNGLAWPLVDPDRKECGGEAKGLLLARKAVELAAALPSPDRAGIRDSLAWALFANGRFEEAVAEGEKAMEEAALEKRAKFEGYLKRLRGEIESHSGPEGREKEAKHVAEIESHVASLEAEVSTRSEWTFEETEDRWWHGQLVKLVDGLKTFSDAEKGLLTAGTSPEHGWGVKRRLDFARTIEERSVAGPEVRARWAEAIASIRDRAQCPMYDGLEIEPQVGLLPIGRDAGSGLWEFAHLETGEPAERAADGRLVLQEETGLVFVLLPGGTFSMGAQSSDPAGPNYDPQAFPDEGPVHEVALSPFFLSKYEMTQGQWLRFVGRNPSRDNPQTYSTRWNRSGLKGDLLHPVEQVNWNMCTEICDRLGVVLPSEAQWEYAARGGTTTVWWTGNDKESLRRSFAANLADRNAKEFGGSGWGVIEDWLDDGNVSHAPVGTYAANPFGLHEVHGNVCEWCRDAHRGDFYGRAPRQDPVSEPVGSPRRVFRGGAFTTSAAFARSASRMSPTPESAGFFLGLRPARVVTGHFATSPLPPSGR